MPDFDIELDFQPSNDLDLELDQQPTDMNLQISQPYARSDYEKLTNKPRINGQELIGDKTLSELIGDGFIIDGGSSKDVRG